MSFTERENITIREKLEHLTTPAVDEAWKKMEEMMGPPPVQEFKSFQTGNKFQLYLNVLLGTLVLSSALILHSAVVRDHLANQKVAIQQDMVKASKLQSLSEPFVPDSLGRDETFVKTGDQMTWAKQPTQEIQGPGALSTVQSEPEASLAFKEVLKTQPKVIDAESEDAVDEESDESTEGQHERWLENPKFNHSHSGVQIGIQALPGISKRHALYAISSELFYREFVTPQQAIEATIGYQPVWIRGIPFIDRRVESGVFIKDSGQVNLLRYATLGLKFYRATHHNVSFSIGPQYGLLLGMKGDVTTTRSGLQGQEKEYTEFTGIENSEGFRKHDVAIVAQLNYDLERIDFSIKLQQSMLDFSKPGVGAAIHRPSSLHFRVGYKLGVKETSTKPTQRLTL